MKIINSRESSEANNLYVWAGPFRSEKSAVDRAKRTPGSVVVYEPESRANYAYWYVCKDYPKGTHPGWVEAIRKALKEAQSS